MSKLRRYYSEGNVYFITANTYHRQRLLLENIDLFWLSMENIKLKLKFEVIAWVIIPNHFHLIIDPKNNNLSEIVKRFKLSFSMNYRKRYEMKSGRVWQLRFWDHIIRNQDDFNRHVDYIHYNPVKHGIENDPFVYKHSSIGKFSEYYQRDWGIAEKLEFDGDFGE